MKRKGLIGLIVLMVMLCGCASNVRKGVSLLEDGKYEKAIAAFQADVDEKTNLDEANRGIALANYEMGNYEEAVTYFEEALANEAEETASIYHLMGTCCMKCEDYEGAVSYYDKALKMEDCTDEMKKEMLFNKIAAYEKSADWESAKTAVTEYLDLYPDDEKALREADFLKTR